ncbi:MAG: hypothetical protein ACPF8Y_08625 [Flavobacteriales bacterium]
MDRQTALLVLQLPDAPTPDEVHDAFEAHVFGIRDFLFRQTVIPQVFRAKVDRLLTASEVGETLGVELPCLDGTVPDMAPLEGTADDVVRTHADNVGRLRTAMAATLDPTCLSRLGECLVRMQRAYLHWMADWSAARPLDTAEVKPMRDEWSPAALATALEGERKGDTLTEDQSTRLAAELLRIRTLSQSAVTA